MRQNARRRTKTTSTTTTTTTMITMMMMVIKVYARTEFKEKCQTEMKKTRRSLHVQTAQKLSSLFGFTWTLIWTRSLWISLSLSLTLSHTHKHIRCRLLHHGLLLDKESKWFIRVRERTIVSTKNAMKRKKRFAENIIYSFIVGGCCRCCRSYGLYCILCAQVRLYNCTRIDAR